MSNKYFEIDDEGKKLFITQKNQKNHRDGSTDPLNDENKGNGSRLTSVSLFSSLGRLIKRTVPHNPWFTKPLSRLK